MKKRLFSLMVAVCMIMSLVPTVFAAGTGVTTATELQNAVASGGTVTLGADITISSPLNITTGVTIDGQGYAINYTGTSSSYAGLQITTNEQVTLTDLTINATSANGRAIKLDSTAPHFTLENSVLNAGQRGIWVGNSGCGTGSTFTVTNSTIKNSQLPTNKTYDNWVAYGTNYRGISLWNMNNAEATITNTDILGFSYGLYAGGETNGTSGADYNGSTITVSNSDIKGWAAYYLWGANSTTTFTNCNLVGISDISGTSNNFSTISIAENMYLDDTWEGAVVKFYGGSITGVRYNTAALALMNVDSALKTDFEFLEDDDETLPQLKYYGTENVEGNPEYYANVWNFYPTTTETAANAYINSVEGYSMNIVTAGTISDYENNFAASSIATASIQPFEEIVTSKPEHIGGGV